MGNQRITTLLFVVFAFFGLKPVAAQYHIEDEYDLLTAQWLETSEQLKTYSGLGAFCNNANFRNETIETLQLIHHYDSLVLDILQDPTLIADVSHREYKRTMKDLEKMETDYSIKSFIDVLRESCITRKTLEQDRDELQKESGMYSYDGQVMVMETKLNKFLKHIDKKIEDMDAHIHKIHPDHVKSVESLLQNQ